MTETKRIVIADSYEIVREGLASRLSAEPGLDVVGQAGDGYSTIKLCRAVTPDIVVLDLSIGRPSGKDTFTKLRAALPAMHILLMGTEATKSYAFHALSLGAAGFVPREASGNDLVNAIRSVGQGYACLPRDCMTEFAGLRRNLTRSGNLYGLSPREIEVLEACSTGIKTKEVADQLSISVRTVETHRNAIYRKTACRNLTDLAQMLSPS